MQMRGERSVSPSLKLNVHWTLTYSLRLAVMNTRWLTLR